MQSINTFFTNNIRIFNNYFSNNNNNNRIFISQKPNYNNCITISYIYHSKMK